MKDAAAPVAIVGGADWSPRASHHFANFAFRHGIPVAAAFRRQDAIPNSCSVYAGNLGYGPNPNLQQRIRDADLILAVGPRLGEATTDGYTLITPDHPGQTLVHVHPDPNELGRVYHADLPICADMGEFSEMIDEWSDPDCVRFHAGEKAHNEWLEWSEPSPRKGVKLDLGPCVKAMREKLPENTIICNGAGNFSGWWHRYWRYGPMPTQLAPTSGAMGYGLPAAVAAALRFTDRPVVCVAGDGDFLMNGQELATAAQYGGDLLVILVDNASYGTIRMHQERDYPARISATALANPDFAALARAYGGWAETVDKTADFAPALDKALKRKGIRLIHCKTDIEQISNATTVAMLRSRPSPKAVRARRCLGWFLGKLPANSGVSLDCLSDARHQLDGNRAVELRPAGRGRPRAFDLRIRRRPMSLARRAPRAFEQTIVDVPGVELRLARRVVRLGRMIVGEMLHQLIEMTAETALSHWSFARHRDLHNAQISGSEPTADAGK